MTLLLLPSLVAWLTVDTAVLPRTPMCHMMENNNLIEIIPFIYYLLLKFAPELLLSTPIGS